MKIISRKQAAVVILFLLSLTCTSCKKTNTAIDFTEVIEKSQRIADNNFSEDINGTCYDKNKPWKVFNRFTDNRYLTSNLEELSKRNVSGDKMDWHFGGLRDSFTIKETRRNKLIRNYKAEYKDVNDYYLVRLNKPMENGEGIYRTFIWINADKWKGGFQIFLEYKIVENKARVLNVKGLIMSNVFESMPPI